MSTTPYAGTSRAGIPSAEELRARISGWGVDLNPADRPSFPQEFRDLPADGEDREPPLAQVEEWPRERSIEHARLTPVFGTSCPPRGVSGRVRKLAYARYSEARAAHWLLLLLADRIDSKSHAVRSLMTTRPDNPVTQTGVLSEFRHRGISSRLGRGRVDVVHHPLDPVIVGAPWVVSGWVATRIVRRLRRALRG